MLTICRYRGSFEGQEKVVYGHKRLSDLTWDLPMKNVG